MVHIAVLAASLVWVAATSAEQETGRRTFPDPGRFAGAIAAFEAADSLSPPPSGAILCTGSSSMRVGIRASPRTWHH